MGEPPAVLGPSCVLACDMAVSNIDAVMDVTDEACAGSEVDSVAPEVSSVPSIDGLSAGLDTIELGPCDLVISSPFAIHSRPPRDLNKKERERVIESCGGRERVRESERRREGERKEREREGEREKEKQTTDRQMDGTNHR